MRDVTSIDERILEREMNGSSLMSVAMLLVVVPASSGCSRALDSDTPDAKQFVASGPESRMQLGVAKLREDGSLEISLSRDMDGNFVEGYFVLKPDDPRFALEMEHLGVLAPGEEVPYFANEKRGE